MGAHLAPDGHVEGAIGDIGGTRKAAFGFVALLVGRRSCCGEVSSPIEDSDRVAWRRSSSPQRCRWLRSIVSANLRGFTPTSL